MVVTKKDREQAYARACFDALRVGLDLIVKEGVPVLITQKGVLYVSIPEEPLYRHHPVVQAVEQLGHGWRFCEKYGCLGYYT